MYLYGSEHALMDFHLNEEKKQKAIEAEQAKKAEEQNAPNTDSGK